jgi:hypothetical protein
VATNGLRPPRGFEPGNLVTGSKQAVHWTSETWWECRLSTGVLPSSWLCWLWSRKGDLQRAWNWDRKAVWDQVGLSHCRHEGLVMLRDEARLRRGHRNDQSRWGHQCSETTLTGESWFHLSTPQGIWTGVPCDGKQTGSPLNQWDMVIMQALHNLMLRPIQPYFYLTYFLHIIYFNTLLCIRYFYTCQIFLKHYYALHIVIHVLCIYITVNIHVTYCINTAHILIIHYYIFFIQITYFNTLLLFHNHENGSKKLNAWRWCTPCMFYF